MNPTVFYNMSYGMYVVSTWDNGRPVGCIANSGMQITSSPATVAVSINHDNYTNKCIKEGGYFALSIIGEEVDPLLIGTFGFFSSKERDKFKEIPYSIKNCLPVPDACLGYITCKVIDTMETATHTVFLGEVTDGDNLKKGTPMTYSYYHKVIKGKSPKNAPTYQAE